MKDDQTICYKVTEAINILEDCIKTRSLDAGKLGNLLHQIRLDANSMEEAIKRRKKAMIQAGIEEEYQKQKGVDKIPTGINKIANGGLIKTKDKYFDITVESGGDILYKNKVRSGVMCVAEKVNHVDKDGFITGTTQKFFFGQTLDYWYAFNQLQQAIEGKKIEILAALKEHGVI
jgi:hypothetical protein